MKEKLFDWIEISIYRDICFNRVFNNDININIKCNEKFNATLFTFKSAEF